jgi:peptidyl-prolyl cis-trans isomerase-like protein 2
MALRDISNFKHLEEVRAEEQARVAGASAEEKIASSIRTNASTEMVLAEFQRQQREREEAEALRAAQAEAAAVEREKQEAEEEEELRRKGGGGAPTKRRRSILIEDLHPGKSVTTGKAAASFTATGVDLATGNTCRTATEEEIREVRYKFARKLGKKGYVQLQTSLGNLNLEIHCDFVPRTAENFLGLCLRGFYDGLSFHRVIKGFMAQTGCPRGDGRGGETVWSLGGGEEGGKEGGATTGFKDELDSRLTHDKRGVLSMANSGKDTNRSQFFITFKSCRHLDNKHTVFGRVVGGLDVLGRLEGVEVGKEDRPKEEVKVLKAVALVNPLEESDAQFDAFVEGRRQEREAKQAFWRDNNALGFTRKGKGKGEEGTGVLSAREAADAERTEGFYSQPGPQKSVGEGVGRYLGSGAGPGRLGGGTVLPQKTAVVGSEAAYMQEVVGPAVHVKESSKAFQELAAQEERKGGAKKRRMAGAFGNFEGW